MTLVKKLIVVALPLTLAVAGCETMGEQDKAMSENASLTEAKKASASAAEAADSAAESARAAEQAARAAERAAAEARAAGDKADRAFRRGLRK